VFVLNVIIEDRDSSRHLSILTRLGPSGKRAIIATPIDAEGGTGDLHITFLLNFYDELRRRVPV